MFKTKACTRDGGDYFIIWANQDDQITWGISNDNEECFLNYFVYNIKL